MGGDGWSMEEVIRWVDDTHPLFAECSSTLTLSLSHPLLSLLLSCSLSRQFTEDVKEDNEPNEQEREDKNSRWTTTTSHNQHHQTVRRDRWRGGDGMV